MLCTGSKNQSLLFASCGLCCWTNVCECQMGRAVCAQCVRTQMLNKHSKQQSPANLLRLFVKKKDSGQWHRNYPCTGAESHTSWQDAFRLTMASALTVQLQHMSKQLQWLVAWSEKRIHFESHSNKTANRKRCSQNGWLKWVNYICSFTLFFCFSLLGEQGNSYCYTFTYS